MYLSPSSGLGQKKLLDELIDKRRTDVTSKTLMARQNPFDQKKTAILAGIGSSQPDLSPKGDIDVLCFPIIDLINSHADMVTTSSCSGRLSVFIEGEKQHKGLLKTGGKGEGGKWLFVTHERGQVTDWLDRTEVGTYEFVDSNLKSIVGNVDSSSRLVLYKYEPFILHVKCRDFFTASKLYNTAMGCGFRESGIGSNNLVAIRINIKLDMPIGYLDEVSRKINFLVPIDYIHFIDDLTLSKFEENEKKMQVLYERIKSSMIDAI